MVALLTQRCVTAVLTALNPLSLFFFKDLEIHTSTNQHQVEVILRQIFSRWGYMGAAHQELLKGSKPSLKLVSM